MDYQQKYRLRPTLATCSCKGQPQVAKDLCEDSGTGHRHGNQAEPYNTVTNPTMIAMVFSPKQEWRLLYDPMKALSRGTLFEELDKPFHPHCHEKNGRILYD